MTTAQAIANPMQATLAPAKRKQLSRKRLWIGRVVTGLSGASLMFDASMKVLKLPVVVQGTVQMGYPESTIVGMGVALLVSALLYLIPRTSVLGAVLLTGYLGGAVATNVRAEQGAFNIAVPVIVACFAWGGLWLRDGQVKQMLPLKQKI